MSRALSMLRPLAFAAAVLADAATAQTAPAYVAVPAGPLTSVLARSAETAPLEVPAFVMREQPVSQGEFRHFVRVHPDWQRGRIARSLADAGYLQAWHSPVLLADEAAADQPVTQVSWFAAQAYCEAESPGGRLPTWNEWEYVAAADAERRDARADPAWLARILGWYARPAAGPLPAVGGPPNVYGVRDVHGLVWEWVDDFNALLVDGDSRSADDPDRLKFCGAGAIDLQDRQNYAVLMRIALLSSLQASDSTGSLGFRCVRPSIQEPR